MKKRITVAEAIALFMQDKGKATIYEPHEIEYCNMWELARFQKDEKCFCEIEVEDPDER